MERSPRTEGSVGPHVPSVTGAKQHDALVDVDPMDEYEHKASPARFVPDKDFLCPICIQTMKDAFLTACGHSFCYMCIITHLSNKSNCPCCGHYLTNKELFPNFLLSKLLAKASVAQLCTNASPAEHLRVALQQGAELSIKELDQLLIVLAERKRKAEQEEAECNMEMLLDFLHRSLQQKQEELSELQTDLEFLKEDISIVENQRVDMSKTKERYQFKLRMLLDGEAPTLDQLGVERSSCGGAVSSLRNGQGGASYRKELKGRLGAGSHKRSETCTEMVSELQDMSASSSLALAKRGRVMAQFEDLQDCYLQKRRRMAALSREKASSCPVKKDVAEETAAQQSGQSGLEDFQSVLTAFTRYSRLRVIAELRHGDLFHSSNIVSSIEFDRDDELFATAGVSRRIKVFEFATVVNEMADVHCPVVEMSTRSKLSCLSWNKYIKSHIASSDYEGIVTVWDVNTCQSIMEYEEHEKRAWSVDFSRTEPTRLVSGSDDGKVKVWCTTQETSVLNIDMKANICCVKYNPGSSNFVAVGSADHHIHYYDLRMPQGPLHIFNGHRKAVSYVKFISPNELASASTDSTLRLWDVQQNCPIRTLKGHTNDKNFVGLTVNSEYIACGSESNEVFVYHKAMSKPAAWHRFGSPDPEDSDDDGSHFISAVCWKSESPTMLAANSQGTIKVLVLAP